MLLGQRTVSEPEWYNSVLAVNILGLFVYEDSRRGSKVEEHYLGGMSETCPRCGAKKFKHELKWATMCCKGHNGCNVNDVQRELSPMQPRTTEARAALNKLRDLFTGTDNMAKLFRSFIRGINNAVSLASKKIELATLPRTANGGTFTPSMIMQGMNILIIYE